MIFWKLSFKFNEKNSDDLIATIVDNCPSKDLLECINEGIMMFSDSKGAALLNPDTSRKSSKRRNVHESKYLRKKG